MKKLIVLIMVLFLAGCCECRNTPDGTLISSEPYLTLDCPCIVLLDGSLSAK